MYQNTLRTVPFRCAFSCLELGYGFNCELGLLLQYFSEWRREL